MAEKIATRASYGKALVELGAENPDIVVLDADLSGSTQTKKFADVYPDRFFNAGIAEDNLMGMAAGLALSGKIAFASTFAMFASTIRTCSTRLTSFVCAKPRLRKTRGRGSACNNCWPSAEVTILEKAFSR